jgi:hypothetical protein
VGARGVELSEHMASSGLADAARAIRERVGPDARYSPFIPPRVRYTPPPPRRRLDRLLWTASLVLLLVVLLLALLVALGL